MCPWSRCTIQAPTRRFGAVRAEFAALEVDGTAGFAKTARGIQVRREGSPGHAVLSPVPVSPRSCVAAVPFRSPETVL